MRRFIAKTVPLYINVRNAILDAILENEIAKDDCLPSEEALAEMFAVSRTTVRNALQSMETDGLITKHRGSETTINRVCLGLNMRIDVAQRFSDLIAASGHKPGIIFRTLEKAPIDFCIAQKLHLKMDTEGYVLSELMSADDKPVLYVREYYPDSTLYRIPSLSNLPKDIYLLSDQYFKEPISYTIREVSAVRETDELLKIMQLNSGKGFIRMEETHYNSDNRPIAYNETIIRDSIRKLQVVCRRM